MTEQVIDSRRRVVAWVSLSRLPFIALNVASFSVGMVIAWSQGHPFNWGVAVLSTLGVGLILLVTHYSNEYFDYETDSLNVEYNKFSGGSRVLPAGLIPRSQALPATFFALVAAVIVWLIIWFYFKTGPLTMVLAAFGLLGGYFYTGKPIQGSYRGAGELILAICTGWLTVNTAYYLQTGTFALIPTLVSIPIAIHGFLAIYLMEIADYTSDRLAGKKTLVVRLGRDRAALLWAIFAPTSFLAITLGVLGGVPRLMAFLSVIPLALIVRNILAVKKQEYKDRKALEKMCATAVVLHVVTSLLYILAFALQI
ncbi:MAG: prenyltransferase [Chloroflexi bacterium]|nr:prenyltransferase [Chloroflexota bacterium]